MKPIEDAPMLGIGSDAVLAALATVVRKPRKPSVRTTPSSNVILETEPRKPKTSNTSGKTISLRTTSALQLADSSMFGIDFTTLDTLVPYPRNTLVTTNETLPVVTNKPTLSLTSVVSKKAKTNATISPSTKAIPTSNVVDLTESTPTFSPNLVTKRLDKSKNCTLVDVAEDTTTGNLRTVLPEMQIRTQASIVDFWLSDNARGERKLIKYVKESVKTIKIGIDTLNNEDMISQLGAAVSRGVTVQLFIDFKKACDGGLDWVKCVLEAGVQVCHSTEKFEWKAAFFDGQILVQGDIRVFSTGYTVVYTGDFVSVLECQFDTMWKAATIKTEDTKRARTDNGMGQREEVEASAFKTDVDLGKKRKQGKRTCFPTTMTFLEMLGL